MIRLLNIFILILVSVSGANAQFTNFLIHPSANNQIEPSIVTHPQNPMILFCSAYTLSGAFRSEGIYISTNGGLTWVGTDTCSGQPISTGHGGDPGPIIDKDGVFILTHQGGFFPGMYANYSTNIGSTWSDNFTIAQNDQDKGSPGTDDNPSSLYYGRSFLVWTRFVSPFPIVISYTTNSGLSWTSFAQVNASLAGRQSLAPVIVSSPNGIQCCAWASALTSSPFNEKSVGFASSTNGGDSWSVEENAYECNGIKTSSLAPWNIRVNGYPAMDIDKTGGPRNGWIYIVTAEKNLAPAGSDPDIVFHRSTDNGATWSSGVRVNQDPFNNGRSQFFPFITVDGNGGLNVVYYDNRNTPDSLEVYLSHSDDGGINWNDHLVSNHKFYPKSVSGAGAGNQGDNIGMTYFNGKLLPVWMDNSTGKYQTWGAIIDVATIGVSPLGNEVPSEFSLRQNYPNPFNPSTKIEFSIPSASNVSLDVFDVSGRLVKSIIKNNSFSPGSYEIVFNGDNLSSGIYFYRLIAGNNVFTRKMVLQK